MDVYCICGRCGAERSGQRRWTLATMAAVRHWPTYNYASANPYLTKKQRKQLAKERAKGKAVVGKHSTTCEQGTKVTVVTCRATGPRCQHVPVCTQRIQHHIIRVSLQCLNQLPRPLVPQLSCLVAGPCCRPLTISTQHKGNHIVRVSLQCLKFPHPCIPAPPSLHPTA